MNGVTQLYQQLVIEPNNLAIVYKSAKFRKKTKRRSVSETKTKFPEVWNTKNIHQPPVSLLKYFIMYFDNKEIFFGHIDNNYWIKSKGNLSIGGLHNLKKFLKHHYKIFTNTQTMLLTLVLSKLKTFKYINPA